MAEAYYYEKKVKFHLDYQSLMAHTRDMRVKRLVIIHMSEDMLLQVDKAECLTHYTTTGFRKIAGSLLLCNDLGCRQCPYQRE